MVGRDSSRGDSRSTRLAVEGVLHKGLKETKVTGALRQQESMLGEEPEKLRGARPGQSPPLDSYYQRQQYILSTYI